MNEERMINLLNRAISMRKMAYAPYSNFFVGASILLEDGSFFDGANVENASYSVTICAERVALSQVVIQGKIKEVVAVAVATGSLKPCSPCGVCRQFLLELLPKELPIIFGNDKGNHKIVTVGSLLPDSFDSSFL